MKTLLVWFLRGYQLLLSPMLGQTCRFYPTCSNYAIEALRTHGAARGSLLAARRVCRCHPWNPGGVDPVPPAPDKGQDRQSPPAARGCNHS
ncbi:membrane protein insertion efficiency factor YidD [Massilia consociata]|uniref:Putative membrane protein insertion efficiency factor n=1 Tax=Massilia consociata TaxID=760117 RepID=A0ABV6FJ18_9BURK